ncbi:MAG: type VI secretion system ImpA family N-terminal domain-containing protein, partial [Krumholzibacteria bacterium]|nr:type VI secretion system ImpA family N-terminal domain-containing protein [Candidatus Krumholzibacteria bacterium]
MSALREIDMPNLDELLAPIDPDRPSGTDLRLVAGDLTLATLDELRREADPRVDPGGETKHADWRGAADLCDRTLRGKSKDLEIAAVYTQALTHLQGLEGLAFGLRLLRALVDGFWATVSPGYDEGEIIEAIRARPLSWIGTSRDFLAAVKKVPLSDPIGEEPRSWFDYEQAQRLDKAGTKSDRAEFDELVEMGLIPTEDWHASLAATPPERLQATLANLQACCDALGELTALCDGKFTESAPYFMDLTGLLDEMLEFLATFAREGAAAAAAGGAAAG